MSRGRWSSGSGPTSRGESVRERAPAGERIHRPARLGGCLAVLAALAAVVLLAGEAGRPALAVEALALGTMAAGVALRMRGEPVGGGALSAAGGIGVVGAVGLAVALVDDPGALVVVTVGIAGVALVALPLVPVTRRGPRALLKLGAGLVFAAVLAGGLLQPVGTTTLLASGALAVVAWDAGEHAVGVGEQLGRIADTTRCEVVHVGAGAGVAALAVVAASLVDGVGRTGLPLPGLALLLVAGVVLTVALHE